MAHPGVHPAYYSKEGPNDKKIFHDYYRWMAYLILFQALVFYIPRFLWKSLEAGKLEAIREYVKTLPDQKSKGKVMTYLLNNKKEVEIPTLSDTFFWSLFFCEVLNLVAALGQMFLMDAFVGNTLLPNIKHIHQVFSPSLRATEVESFIKAFPRVTKCTFSLYGPSGSIVTYDAICILAYNALIEKIVVLLW